MTGYNDQVVDKIRDKSYHRILDKIWVIVLLPLMFDEGLGWNQTLVAVSFTVKQSPLI